MAHTADRRSEKNLSQTPEAKARRKGYRDRVNNGICVTETCGGETSRNRSYCYDCSLLQKRRVYKTGLRFHLADVGVNWETATTLTPQQIKRILDAARTVTV